MYPVHHPTLKIEQAERHREAALERLATTAGGRRRWWSRVARNGAADATPAVPAMPAPAPIAEPRPAEAPEPVMVGTTDDDNRLLVGQ